MIHNPVGDTPTRCHCGVEFGGSDHCPECGCEQYETELCQVCPDLLQEAKDQARLDCQIWENLGTGIEGDKALTRIQRHYLSIASRELRSETA